MIGRSAESEQPDAIRIVHLFVQNAFDAGIFQRCDERTGVGAIPEGQQLQEEAPVERKGLPTLGAPFLADVYAGAGFWYGYV